MAKDTHELQVGSKVWKLGDSQKGHWGFSIKNVLSILCPRQQDLNASKENNTKDSGKDERTT